MFWTLGTLDWLVILASILIIVSGLVVLFVEKNRLELGVTKLRRIQSTLIQIRASEAQFMQSLGLLLTPLLTTYPVVKPIYIERLRAENLRWHAHVLTVCQYYMTQE